MAQKDKKQTDVSLKFLVMETRNNITQKSWNIFIICFIVVVLCFFGWLSDVVFNIASFVVVVAVVAMIFWYVFWRK